MVYFLSNPWVLHALQSSCSRAIPTSLFCVSHCNLAVGTSLGLLTLTFISGGFICQPQHPKSPLLVRGKVTIPSHNFFTRYLPQHIPLRLPFFFCRSEESPSSAILATKMVSKLTTMLRTIVWLAFWAVNCAGNIIPSISMTRHVTASSCCSPQPSQQIVVQDDVNSSSWYCALLLNGDTQNCCAQDVQNCETAGVCVDQVSCSTGCSLPPVIATTTTTFTW